MDAATASVNSKTVRRRAIGHYSFRALELAETTEETEWDVTTEQAEQTEKTYFGLASSADSVVVGLRCSVALAVSS